MPARGSGRGGADHRSRRERSSRRRRPAPRATGRTITGPIDGFLPLEGAKVFYAITTSYAPRRSSHYVVDATTSAAPTQITDRAVSWRVAPSAKHVVFSTGSEIELAQLPCAHAPGGGRGGDRPGVVDDARVIYAVVACAPKAPPPASP